VATDLAVTTLSTSQTLLSYVTGGVARAVVINSDGSVQTDSTAVATASTIAISGRDIIGATNTAINRYEIQPFATTVAVSFDKISQITFRYESYGVSAADRASQVVDMISSNSGNGDVAENMTVRELSRADAKEILGFSVEEFNVYEYENCQSTVCVWEDLPAAGEVVVSDVTGEVMAVKSLLASAKNIVGVVTTDPAMILKKNLKVGQ
jgi:hypothetical protein